MLTALIAISIGFRQALASGANKWELMPYCETQGGNLIFGMKIISTKNKEWRRVTPRDVIQVQPQDSIQWVTYRYDGTVLDKEGEYLVRLKQRSSKRHHDETLYHTYPRKYIRSSLESKLNDGSIRIRLQDGITKQPNEQVDPVDFHPQKHFWVSNKIDEFGDDIEEGKKAAERVPNKRFKWKPLKMEKEDVVPKSVDPITKEVKKDIVSLKPDSIYYPVEVNHCKPVHEDKVLPEKPEKKSTSTFETDDEELKPVRSRSKGKTAAYSAYYDMYNQEGDEYYDELVEELETQTQKAYRKGFYAGYRNAQKMHQ